MFSAMRAMTASLGMRVMTPCWAAMVRISCLAGAIAIDAVTTHGLFPGDSLARLRASGLFGTIATTDSHPRAVALADDFLQVASTAALLTEHLTHNR